MFLGGLLLFTSCILCLISCLFSLFVCLFGSCFVDLSRVIAIHFEKIYIYKQTISVHLFIYFPLSDSSICCVASLVCFSIISKVNILYCSSLFLFSTGPHSLFCVLFFFPRVIIPTSSVFYSLLLVFALRRGGESYRHSQRAYSPFFFLVFNPLTLRNLFLLLSCFVCFVSCVAVHTHTHTYTEQIRCTALIAFRSFLWSTPLYSFLFIVICVQQQIAHLLLRNTY